MKRVMTAVAAMALMTGAAVAQTNFQPSDPEQAQRKGTIAQPPGPGEGPADQSSGMTGGGTMDSATTANPSAARPADGPAVGTTVQPSDPEESQRKGTINQPGDTVTR